MSTPSGPKVVVIGAGFGGLAAVIELRKLGYDDIVVFEKGDDVGGVWRENTYPGAACDVPSPFYSFSFEPNPRWPRRFSQQPAILQYMRDIADKYDVRSHVRFQTEVESASFNDADRTWEITLSTGEIVRADFLVSAVGQLSRPSFAPIPGREKFTGVEMHSALWNHDVDLTGKRVAVIGTGASAIQFIPEVQKVAGHLTVFQRTAPYVIPRPDTEFTAMHQRIFAAVPAAQLVERGTWYGLVEALSVAWVYAKPLAGVVRAVSKRHMKSQTKAKPGLFEKVWPDYPIGCKRVLFSSDYLPALAQPNVDLRTDRISEITEKGIRTADGVEHEFDVIIWGTGFKATEFLAPMTITGKDGRKLDDAWRSGAHAYYGLTVPDFPNLVIMYGPNTNTGGGSIIYFLEAQAHYLGKLVKNAVERGGPLTVRADVERKFDEKIQGLLTGSVWSQCTSWYRQSDGRITNNWPLLGIEYKKQAKFNPADYEVVS